MEGECIHYDYTNSGFLIPVIWDSQWVIRSAYQIADHILSARSQIKHEAEDVNLFLDRGLFQGSLNSEVSTCPTCAMAAAERDTS